MATAISLSNFQTACGNCYDAISSGDFANAWKYYAMAEAQNSGLVLDGSYAEHRMRLREALTGLKTAITAAQAAAGASADSGRRFLRTRTGFQT